MADVPHVRVRHVIGSDFVEVEGSPAFADEVLSLFRAWCQRQADAVALQEMRRREAQRGERITAAIRELRVLQPRFLHRSVRA